MAILIEANYSKKLGLPNYSSHQYSVTVRTELNDLSQLPQANAQLYALLQESVDSQIQNPGHVPGDVPVPPPPKQPVKGGWSCSERQQELIQKLVKDLGLTWDRVKARCLSRFGKDVKGINKVEASGFIHELMTEERRKALPNGRNGSFQERKPAYDL